MNDTAVMHRLIWKDITSITPLLMVAGIGIAVMNLLIFLVWQSGEMPNDAFVGWSVALWIIFPQLVAFGSPAMLLGTEQENGTLDWLRTLPVRWQHVSTAKLIVAALAVAVVWFMSSSVVWLTSFGWQPNPYSASDGLVSFRGVLILGFFSVFMLLLGFAMLYSLRSPLLALSLEVPVLLFTLIVVANVVRKTAWMHAPTIPPSGLYTGITILFVLWLLQRFLARQRMIAPRESAFGRAIKSATEIEYRPSALPVYSRPSEAVSLLWQQLRQTGPLCLALIVLCTLLTVLFTVSQSEVHRLTTLRILGAMSAPLILLSASWIGAIVFYGDNVHRRCGFFADRGISPTRVWWTRMLPPAVSCLVLIVTVTVIGLGTRDELWSQMWGNPWNLVALVMVQFAFGQLVSQWIDRPILAFLAAPAYTCVSLAPVLYLLERYHSHSHLAAIVLTVPVLLLASWQLTRPWLDGRTSSGYTARVFAYTAVAVLIPCVYLWVVSNHLFFRTLSTTALTGVTP